MKQQRFRHGRKALAVFLIGSLLAVNLTGCRILSGFLDTTAYTRIQGERVREEVVIRPLETLPMEGSVTKEEVLEAMLPSFYDGRQNGKSPRIQNQGNLGTCWAFAALGALETILLPEEVQFSADHMVANNGYGLSVKEGGNMSIALSYLTSWKGPVFEEDDPYDDGKTNPEAPVRYHLQQAEYLNQDLNAIKEAILRYGAVTASVFVDERMLVSGASNEYYDAEQYTYCYMGSTAPNHDVIIVGWDDNFDAEKFKVKPPKNGAFLCQNSWGSSFGDQGYFYVSYYDSLIQTHVLCYERLDEVGVYKDIYQHDELGYGAQIGFRSSIAWGANLFTAREDSDLSAVSFVSVVPQTSYEIYIQRIPDNLKEEEVLSLLSVDVEKVTPNAAGIVPRAGYYTIDLETMVPLKQGERFAVILKVTSEISISPLAADPSGNHETGMESFISADGTKWIDAGKDYQCVICLKAFTK